MEAEKTYNRHTQIGRMFPQGIEAKSIWFNGNCIFRSGKSNPVMSEFFIDGEYTNLIKIGNHVIAYNYAGLGRIARLRNGAATYETVADHSVKMVGIGKHEILLVIDYTEAKFIFIRNDGNVEFAMSAAMQAFMQRLNVVTNQVFIANGILYLGTFYEDKEPADHLFNTVVMIQLDSDMKPVREIMHEQYGINPGTKIEEDRQYPMANKIILSAEYDEASDRVFVEYPIGMMNNYLKTRYVSTDDFTALNFTENVLISASDDYATSTASIKNSMARVTKRNQIGQYAEGGIDEFYRSVGDLPEYSFAYLIKDYQSWLLSKQLGSGLSRYQFEYQMFGNLLGYVDDRYYTIADDTAEDLWNSPPLRLNHGIWGSTEDGFEKLSDSVIGIDTDVVLFGCNNTEGIYFIRFASGFNTALYYMTF